jgi:hypothetical protein
LPISAFRHFTSASLPLRWASRRLDRWKSNQRYPEPAWLPLEVLIGLDRTARHPILEHGLDTPRDAMVLFYGLFSYIIAALILQRPKP